MLGEFANHADMMVSAQDALVDIEYSRDNVLLVLNQMDVQHVQAQNAYPARLVTILTHKPRHALTAQISTHIAHLAMIRNSALLVLMVLPT